MLAHDPFFLKHNSPGPDDTDLIGAISDVYFTREVQWLLNTYIHPQVVQEGDKWIVYLVFTSRQPPYRMLKRKAQTCNSEKDASLVYDLYRQVAKSTRVSRTKAKMLEVCCN
ncbi:MAG: hypothetical protein AAGI38_07765 [Bacteroidota bacterium]